jgi:hypothetical protein
LFQNTKYSKTDACSLAFCGIWLWERNQFLLLQQQQQQRRKEEQSTEASSTSTSTTCSLSLLLQRPFEIFIVLLLMVTIIIWCFDPNSTTITILLVIIVSLFLWKLFEFQYTRSVFRQQLAITEYYHRRNKQQGRQDDNGITIPNNDTDDPGLMIFLSRHQREIYGDGTHAFCGCANAKDNPIDTIINDEGHCYDETNPQQQIRGGQGGDFCSLLFKLIGNCCCGVLCNCYCQLCGMCAIAQEHRYLKDIIPSTDYHLWQRDYITQEPWKDYYNKIIRLKLSNESNFTSHFKAMSILSKRLVISAFLFLCFVSSFTFLPVHFPRWQILVVRKPTLLT